MFTGFTPETVEFLWGIRFNNERGWFLDHKPVYLDTLYNPMTDLAEESLAFLRKKRPAYPLNRKVSRIYRDARRLYGRGPYKDHLWFSIEEPAEDWTGRPTYWFELGADYWSYGLGYWRPAPVTMAKLRQKIARDPAAMEKLTRRVNRSREFSLEIEAYRRPKGTPPSPLLEPWYLGRTFTIMHEDTLSEELYGREIAVRIQKGFAFLLPLYDYLRTVDAEPDPAESRTNSGKR